MKLMSKTEALEVYSPKIYAPCREWGVREWAIALTNRYQLRKYHRFCISQQSYRLPAHQLIDLKDQAKKLFLYPMGEKSAASAYLADHPPIRDQSVADYFLAVDDWEDPKYADWACRVRLSGAFGLDTEVEVAGSTDAELTNEVRSDLAKLVETPAWQLRQNHAIENEGFFIAVDLKASDESLKRAFSTWLARARATSGVQAVGKVFTSEEAHIWTSQYYLPYLDLTFWSELEGRRIPDEVMPDVLYPSRFRPDIEKIRTAFKRKAERIVSKAFVDALRLQLREIDSLGID